MDGDDRTGTDGSGPGFLPGYEAARLIGRGGYGRVYQAVDTVHDRLVAIKILGDVLDDAGRRRFDRERKAMGRLSGDPNIVTIHDSGYAGDGRAYLVMELAAGGSLQDRLDREGPIPWTEAVSMVADVARAVQGAHDGGVLHRDIKPANILVDRFGTPKLSDFGIATSVAATNRTGGTGGLAATLAHTAPELLEGRPATTAVDVYALGSTLHTVITGSAPFARPGDEGVGPVVGRILSEAPPDLRLVGVPDELASVIEQALAKRPEWRPSSPSELATRLREAVAGLERSVTLRVEPPEIRPGSGRGGGHRGGPDPAVWATVAAGGPPFAPSRPGDHADPVVPVAGSVWSADPPGGRGGVDSRSPSRSGAGSGSVVPAHDPDRYGYPSADRPPGVGQSGRIGQAAPARHEPERRRPFRAERLWWALGALLFFGSVGGALGFALSRFPGAERADERHPADVVQAERGADPDLSGDDLAQSIQQDEVEGPEVGPPPTVASAATGLVVTAAGYAEDSVDACGDTTYYPPELAGDGRDDTTWRIAGDGVGQRLELALGGSRVITEVGLLPGYAKVDPCDGTDRFVQNRRVVEVTWIIGDRTVPQRLDPDRPEVQSIEVEEGPPVDTVVVEIVETTGAERDFTALSEVRIAGR